MGALIGTVIRAAIVLLAGFGAKAAVDKIAPDIPGRLLPDPGVLSEDGQVSTKKIISVVILSIVGAVIVRILARKLGLRILY